ncbi:MAG: glycoside hydrolase family 2 TIM barrel-domain containing protein [Kiritimatiellia bacterium]
MRTSLLSLVVALGASMVLAGVAELPNGGIWKDTDGVMINAHGGALMKDGDTWYWYGEHKTAGRAGNKAWVGVSCYSSTNLLDWKNEGIAFKVATPEEVKANPKLAGVEAGCILERPKVVKAQDGSRYVMYFHLEPKGQGYNGAQTGIAESPTPTGPFTLVWNGRPNAGQKPVNGKDDDPLEWRAPWGSMAKQWRFHLPGGQMSRDMTLYTDPKDGTVYHIFASEDNSCLHLAEIRPDGLGYTGKWARLSHGDWTEAPAVVKHGDWYFLIGSGCTGWRPNPARYYRAKSVWGPWERLGNPCRGGKNPEITWGGQSTGIFEANGTAFAMFDQWRPSNAIDGRYVWVPIAFNDRGEMTLDWRETFKPQLAEPWEDEYVSEVDRLPARTPIRPLDSRYTLNLDGEWDFTFVNCTSAAESTSRREVTPGTSRSETITVPSCWQVEGVRRGKTWDPPLYINIKYPIAYDPPRVMTAPKDTDWTSYAFRNPRGIYRKRVTLPKDWAGRRVTLRLNGYSSAVYVRVDGKTVGYGEDGRLPNEWDLTPYLSTSTSPCHLDLELEVLKHSDGTYLEDQDFWRLSGLFRSVELLSEAPNGLRDFNVRTRTSNGTGIVSVVAKASAPVTWKVFDSKGDEIGRGAGNEELTVPNVVLWTSAKPVLYRVRVECAGDVYEKRFGFRTVTIEDGVLKLNGERVVIHGVNRHEMSPIGGYAMTRAEMKKDIELLKKFNVNAVRTSHYPNDPYWYDLCDEHGILLVAEANIECHGSGHPMGNDTLSHRPSWRKSFVERNLNQVAVLRDHPSVILWSLGNESGRGGNMIAAYEAVKRADPTRPVQYEGVLNPYGKQPFDAYGTDIICPMYEQPHAIARAIEKDFKRPYILCEYAHAMGNSTGDFDEYMALLDKYPSFQGGFIWDFADQALLVDGKLKYGGDFGDKPNDGHGHCNGLFDALRNPHPGAYEVGYWYGGRKEVEKGGGDGEIKPAVHCPPPPHLSTFSLSFWRAPTDNDRGNKLPRRAQVWRKATETGVLPEGVTTNLVVTKTVKGYDVDFTLTVPDGLPELPRAGLVFEVPGTPETVVSWHGAGPRENYCDRKASTPVGDYAMTVAELNDSHYVRPQECGHRTATDRLQIGNLVLSTPTPHADTFAPFEWNVQPWTVFAQDAARHVEELPASDGKLRVYIDAAMSGVGGDDSWGARPHDPYRLEGARTYRLAFTVERKD